MKVFGCDVVDTVDLWWWCEGVHRCQQQGATGRAVFRAKLVCSPPTTHTGEILKRVSSSGRLSVAVSVGKYVSCSWLYWELET